MQHAQLAVARIHYLQQARNMHVQLQTALWPGLYLGQTDDSAGVPPACMRMVPLVIMIIDILLALAVENPYSCAKQFQIA